MRAISVATLFVHCMLLRSGAVLTAWLLVLKAKTLLSLAENTNLIYCEPEYEVHLRT